MDRHDVLKRLLYPKCKSASEFKFDNLTASPLLSYITVQDIAQLNKIATSLKYSSKPKEKYAMIDKIMTNRGFKKMASGTNRVAYRSLNDYRVVIKIAIDKVGLSDNGNEYRNQQLLKPFVTKCFEVSPCGTVGLFERVIPITSREEFINLSDSIFDLINTLIGKYVLEDIGEKFYMNYGLREGFGPVLLDYPYLFELDGKKLKCNVPEPMEPRGYCGGEIDYDLGYNNLICKKCGKRYLATELKADCKSEKPKIIIEGEDSVMRCVLKRGDEIVSLLNSEDHVSTNTIRDKKDFVNLKCRISERKEEEKEEEYRPTIKTSDEVHLKARLRRMPSGKDIDEEARRKEAIIESRSEKIKVSLNETITPVVETEEEESNISVRLSSNNNSEESTKETSNLVVETSVDNITEEPQDEKEVVEDASENKSDSVTIINGEIWMNDTLIGYTLEKVENEYEKIEYDDNVDYSIDDKSVEGLQIVHSVSNDEVELGFKNEIIENNSTDFTRNKNYKTKDVVSPIENHFSNADANKAEEKIKEKEEEPMKEVEVNRDNLNNGNREIPEVIIHRRKEESADTSDEDEDDDQPESLGEEYECNEESESIYDEY